MLLIVLLAFVLLCSLGPAALFVANLRLYREPPQQQGAPAQVAVLIPARNEEQNLSACVGAVLANTHVQLDVLILDDNSTDGTAASAIRLAAEDRRVKLLRGAALPQGWNGKQFACAQLADAAATGGAPLLLFLDADVRLTPDAIARMVQFHRESGAALVSGFPHQTTVTTLEWLLLPLIHFVLLAFLPLNRMRRSVNPAYAAGCGQFFLVERGAYLASGGHQAIRRTRHDGLLLPRVLRANGYRTDLADLTNLAEVRMYGSGVEVWRGLSKNATEGLAAPARIVPFTLLLLLGQVAPALLLLAWAVRCTSKIISGEPAGFPIRGTWFTAVSCALCVACVGSFLPRILAARGFRQPWKSAWLHPLGVLLLVVLQWSALLRQVRGKPVLWRSRSYQTSSDT